MSATDARLEFFRALCAPFGPDEVTHLRGFTYVKSRRLMNRLDDVAGPDGWYPQYRFNERGFTCRLHILVPVNGDGTAVWMWKEDGGGVEGMVKKVDNAKVVDQDNDEKSAYTNAFRRACSVWGLARDLYREGVPAYLGRAAVVHEPPRDGRDPAPAGNGRAPAAAPPADRRPAAPSAPPRDLTRMPTSGKGAFAWAKDLESHFGFAVVKRMNALAADLGHGGRMVDWTPDQAAQVCGAMVDEIRTWDAYQGEFDGGEVPNRP